MKRIPWWEPRTDGIKEKELISKVLESNFPNDGEFTTQFEEAIVKLLKCKYAVAVTSGTSAMFLALKALDVGHGDEVIVPDMTFIATANAAEMTDAKPILVDVDPKTMTISPSAFSEAITERTKVVMPVHVSGRGANMEEIMKIANEHNIFVIEDAAEAFMSKYRGRNLGTFGVMGCFSFSPPKTITTGQGGMIITNNGKIHRKLRELKDQGRPVRGTGGADIHKSIGYNFKLTNIQAALGLAQLAYIDARIKRLLRNYKLYIKNLKGVDGISLFEFNIRNGAIPLWTDALIERRDELERFLKENGIDSRKFWYPLHTQAPYKQPDDKFPNSTKLSPKALWLPSAFTLTDEDIETVCDYIRKFMGTE